MTHRVALQFSLAQDTFLRIQIWTEILMFEVLNGPTGRLLGLLILNDSSGGSRDLTGTNNLPAGGHKPELQI